MKTLSEKNRDVKGRWRNLTIAFRVSPEENEDIHRRARLAGLTKQDYICRRCQERDVVVMGNPRVYKALKGQMQEILDELKRIASGDPVDEDLTETIDLVCTILDGLKQEDR